jgi:hypothetical protein
MYTGVRERDGLLVTIHVGPPVSELRTSPLHAEYALHRSLHAEARHSRVCRAVSLLRLPRGTALITERLEGLSLARYHAEVGLTSGELAVVGAELASTLDELHTAGILAGEITADGITLEPHTLATQMGTLRTASPLCAPRPPMPGDSPSHVSPERSGCSPDAVDARSDLFALGVTLYTLLCGYPPFEATTLPERATAPWTQYPAAPKHEVDDGAAELFALILELLAPAPARRPRSAAEVARRLAELDDIERQRPRALLSRGAPHAARSVRPDHTAGDDVAKSVSSRRRAATCDDSGTGAVRRTLDAALARAAVGSFEVVRADVSGPDAEEALVAELVRQGSLRDPPVTLLLGRTAADGRDGGPHAAITSAAGALSLQAAFARCWSAAHGASEPGSSAARTETRVDGAAGADDPQPAGGARDAVLARVTAGASAQAPRIVALLGLERADAATRAAIEAMRRARPPGVVLVGIASGAPEPTRDGSEGRCDDTGDALAIAALADLDALSLCAGDSAARDVRRRRGGP